MADLQQSSRTIKPSLKTEYIQSPQTQTKDLDDDSSFEVSLEMAGLILALWGEDNYDDYNLESLPISSSSSFYIASKALYYYVKKKIPPAPHGNKPIHFFGWGWLAPTEGGCSFSISLPN
jgi:hypothetical protein